MKRKIVLSIYWSQVHDCLGQTRRAHDVTDCKSSQKSLAGSSSVSACQLAQAIENERPDSPYPNRSGSFLLAQKTVEASLLRDPRRVDVAVAEFEQVGGMNESRRLPTGSNAYATPDIVLRSPQALDPRGAGAVAPTPVIGSRGVRGLRARRGLLEPPAATSVAATSAPPSLGGSTLPPMPVVVSVTVRAVLNCPLARVRENSSLLLTATHSLVINLPIVSLLRCSAAPVRLYGLTCFGARLGPKVKDGPERSRKPSNGFSVTTLERDDARRSCISIIRIRVSRYSAFVLRT